MTTKHMEQIKALIEMGVSPDEAARLVLGDAPAQAAAPVASPKAKKTNKFHAEVIVAGREHRLARQALAAQLRADKVDLSGPAGARRWAAAKKAAGIR